MSILYPQHIKATGIFNSGLLVGNKTVLEQLAKKGQAGSVFWFIGGETDIASQNAERDYGQLGNGGRGFKANLDVGHGGTFFEANEGEFGKAAVSWAKYTLKGDAAAKKDLFGRQGLAKRGWEIEWKNFWVPRGW